MSETGWGLASFSTGICVRHERSTGAKGSSRFTPHDRKCDPERCGLPLRTTIFGDHDITSWTILTKLFTGVEIRTPAGKWVLGTSILLGLVGRYLSLVALLLSFLPAAPFRITQRGIERDSILALFSLAKVLG